MADAERRLRVFISYARSDASDFAQELLQGLELAGFDPVMDRHDIAAAEDWEVRLGSLISSAGTIVFVVSPAATRSTRCAWEIERARELSKRIIPVVWQEVPVAETPSALHRLHYIFFTAGTSFTKSLSELAAALRTDVDWIREHTRLAEEALRWRSRNYPESMLLRGLDLDSARQWLTAWKLPSPEPTELHRQFVSASEDLANAAVARERSRRQMQVAILSVFTGTLTVLSLAAGAMFLGERSARQREAIALTAATRATAIAREQQGIAARNEAEALRARRSAEESAAEAEHSATLAAATAQRNAALAKRVSEELLRTALMAEAREELIAAISELSISEQADRTRILFLAGAAQAGLSLRAIDVIVSGEIGNAERYNQRYRSPVYPGGRTGVTIGVGYDLGYASPDAIDIEWATLPQADRDRLRRLAGVRGSEAASALSSVADIDITYEAAVLQFVHFELPRAVANTRRVFPNTSDLPTDSFGALVSLVYNRGPSLGPSERRAEMRNIAQLMRDREFDAIPSEIRGMKRIWESQPEARGLVLRRELEAVLFERGISTLRNRQAGLQADIDH